MGSWLVGLGVEGSVLSCFCDPFWFCGLVGVADSFFLGCEFSSFVRYVLTSLLFYLFVAYLRVLFITVLNMIFGYFNFWG